MVTGNYRKLSLNKETLRALNRPEVMIAGGASPGGMYGPMYNGKMSPKKADKVWGGILTYGCCGSSSSSPTPEE